MKQITPSPANEQSISEMFDAIAPRYDVLNRLLSMRQDQRWRKHLMRRVPNRPNGVFVDVATGTGDIVLQALRRHSEYSKYYGVDISAGMLAQARKKIAGKNWPVQFQKMSACALEFADASIDCLTIGFGFRNVKDKPLALREFARCLKPNGTILILEFFRAPSSVSQKLFDFYFQNILPRIGGLISSREAYEYLPRSVGQFYSLNELPDVARKAGLQVTYNRSFLFGTCSLVELKKA